MTAPLVDGKRRGHQHGPPRVWDALPSRVDGSAARPDVIVSGSGVRARRFVHLEVIE